MNRVTIQARSLARRTGLKRLYYRIFPQSGYEQKLRAALLQQLRANDVVWDVGANRGIYTKLFCEHTGPLGRVYAFEPAPATFEMLRGNVAEYPWAHVEPVAFSNFDGESQMICNPDYDVASHLQWNSDAAPTGGAVRVRVMRGDTFRSSAGVAPNLIKVDVEGFEEEVLEGMSDVLSAPELRAIFIEVHFQILEERNRVEAPVRIEKLLKKKGLQTTWVDSGHLCGFKQAA